MPDGGIGAKGKRQSVEEGKFGQSDETGRTGKILFSEHLPGGLFWNLVIQYYNMVFWGKCPNPAEMRSFV
jgi:hypothetical protein